MNKLSVLISFCFFSMGASASTALVPDKEMTTIKGVSVAAAEMSAFAIMVPKYTFSQGARDPKVVASCTFPEDVASANGSQLVQHVDLRREKDSSYSLQVPDSGMRGTCEYVLDSVYLSITDKELYELFKIRSQASVDYGNYLLGSYGPDDVLKLAAKGTTINCEFSKAKEESASCFHGDEPVVDDLEITGVGGSFSLDFKDKPKDIFDTVAIQTH